MFLKSKKVYKIKDYKNREVNLLPRDLYQVSRQRVLGIAGLVILVISIAIVIGYEYSLIQMRNDLESEIKRKTVEMSSITTSIQNQNVIKSLETRINQKKILIDFIDDRNRSILEIINLFESATMNEIYLTSLSADSEDSFVISATATSNEAISYIINRLKYLEQADGSPYFTKVFTNGIVRNQNEDGNILYLFQLQCEFEGGINEVK